jgi:hypothetical protein
VSHAKLFLKGEICMKYISLCFLILVGNSWAADFPNRCIGIPIRDLTVILSADRPSVVLLNNVSRSDIWITHPVPEPSASAGWNSRLQPGNWSALALNEKQFEISCIESKPGHEQQVPCSSVISVCRFHHVKSTEPATATFWIGENMDLDSLHTIIGQRGFEISAEKS